jgi:Tol biopolymer transport system component
MKADGSELRQMTLALDQGINQIVWSPDGTRLATDILYKETLVFDADSPWSEIPPSPLPPFGENDTEFFGAYSWSPDGKFLAGWSNNSAKIRLRIAIYSFETGKYQEFPGWGDWPMWLSDGRRLLFDSHEGDFGSTFSILDTETGERHEVISSEILSIAPDRILPGLTLSPDNRSIYFARSHTEADIWMLTFDQEP